VTGVQTCALPISQQGGSINPEPGKKEILGGAFGGGGPKKNDPIPQSPLSPKGFKTPFKKPEFSSLSPTGYGQPPGPPQPVSPSEFVSRYMSWQPPSNAKKGSSWSDNKSRKNTLS